MLARPATALAATLLAATCLAPATTAAAATHVQAPAPAVHVMADDTGIGVLLSVTQDGVPVESLTAGAQIVYQVDVTNNADPALEAIAVTETSGAITFKAQGQASAAKGASATFVSDPVPVTAEQAAAGALAPSIKVTATRGGNPVEKTEPLSLPFGTPVAAPAPSQTSTPSATSSPTQTATQTPTATPTVTEQVTQMPLEEQTEQVKIPAGEPATASPIGAPTLILGFGVVGAGLLAVIAAAVIGRRRQTLD